MKDRLAKAYGTSPRQGEAAATKSDASRTMGQESLIKTDMPPSPTAGRQPAKSKKTGAPASREGLIKAAEASERFIKTGASGTEKAAKFLLLLGQEEAAKIGRAHV